MPVQSEIVDGNGGSYKACVTSRGELVVGKLAFSDVYQVDAAVDDTAYNFVPPLGGKRFVVTDILLSTDRNIGTNGANVLVYEAASPTSTTSTKTILTLDMLKNTARDITGLNLILTKGVWLNIKTDDNSVNATVMGYYVNE